MTTPELSEDTFFEALVGGDADRLEALLVDDFVIVDVASGAAVEREAFVAAVRDEVVTFDAIELVERSIRRYGDAAIVVGRTAMRGAVAGGGFELASRYTHVLLRDRSGRWLVASAQGTPIAADA